MKRIKKIAASIMAVAAMATSMMGISASAASSTATWYARDVNVAGAPSSTDIIANCTIVYTTYGARAYCNSAASTVNGVSGYTKVTCTNGTMNAKYLHGMGTNVYCNANLNVVIDGVNYRFTAYTSAANNTYTAGGTINTLYS